MRLDDKINRAVEESGQPRRTLALFMPREMAQRFPEHFLGLPVIGRDDLPPDTFYIADPRYFGRRSP